MQRYSMTGSDSGPDGTEFWCGTCMRPPEDDDVVTMDEIDTSRPPGELPAPWGWVQTVVRKVRTVRGR